MRGCWVVFLLLLAPSVTAGFSETFDVRTSSANTYFKNIDNPPASGNLATFTIEDEFPWSYETVSHRAFVELTYTAEFLMGSDGIWNVTVENGKAGLLCWLHVSTIAPGGFLTGDLVVVVPLNVFCNTISAGNIQEHEHDVFINRTVLSGSPDIPENEVISVKWTHEDVVIVSQASPFEILTGLSGVEFLAVVGLGAALLVVGATTRHKPAKMITASLTMLLAVLLLFFSLSPVLLVMATALGLGSGLIFFFLFLDRLKEAQARGPRRFFE